MILYVKDNSGVLFLVKILEKYKVEFRKYGNIIICDHFYSSDDSSILINKLPKSKIIGILQNDVLLCNTLYKKDSIISFEVFGSYLYSNNLSEQPVLLQINNDKFLLLSENLKNSMDITTYSSIFQSVKVFNYSSKPSIIGIGGLHE